MKNKLLTQVYKSTIEKKSVNDIHKELYELTIKEKSTLSVKPLLKYSKAVAKQSHKFSGDSLALLLFFMKSAVNYKSNLLINEMIRQDDGKEKELLLKNALNGSSDKIFFIASQHNDCAKDHLQAQGKIYIDENYKKYDKDGQIEAFVNANHIQTVQYITGAPTWFITRPYCRHYFVRKSFEDVISGNYSIPTRQIGDRTFSTPSLASYDYYTDRLKFLIHLNKAFPQPKLKILIEKTKILRSKWKKEYNLDKKYVKMQHI